jgi:hypothetical protein
MQETKKNHLITVVTTKNHFTNIKVFLGLLVFNFHTINRKKKPPFQRKQIQVSTLQGLPPCLQQKNQTSKLYLSILILGVIIYIWKDTVYEKRKKEKKRKGEDFNSTHQVLIKSIYDCLHYEQGISDQNRRMLNLDKEILDAKSSELYPTNHPSENINPKPEPKALYIIIHIPDSQASVSFNSSRGENQRLSACHSAKPITSSRFHMHYQRKKAKWCFGELCPATHNCMRCLNRSSIVCACDCHMMQFLTKLVLQENTTAGINISLAGWLSVCLSVRPSVHRHAKVTPKLSN